MAVTAEMTINNTVLPLFTEWQDTEVIASFREGNIQPNLSVEKVTFVNEAAQFFLDYIQKGATAQSPGIFEGPSGTLTLSDEINTSTIGEFIVDLSDDLEILNRNEIRTKLILKDGIDQFRNLALSTTYALLETQGKIGSADYTDVRYVVEKKIDLLSEVVASYVLFLMLKELAEAIFRIGNALANAFGHTSGGVTGPAAGAGYTILVVALEVAYVAFLIIAIVDLGKKLTSLIPVVRKHKSTNFRTALEKGVSALGFNFVSPIPELDFLYYLPSKPDEDDPLSSGIPKDSDFGYSVGEMIELAEIMFNAKIQIIDGDVILRSENDPFWDQDSTYVMPDYLLEEPQAIQRYNTNELNARVLISHLVDPNDTWTTNNFKGTDFEVVTEPQNVTDAKNVNIKGLDQVNIPMALANRKDSLTDLEKTIRSAASAIDAVLKFFGKSSKLASKVQNRVGILKVSDNTHSVAKWVVLSGGTIPVNHRDLYSAKVLWNKYHNEKSFIENDFGGQYLIFQGVERLPFGFTDFLKTINNSRFTDPEGRKGKFDDFNWTFEQTISNVNFRIKEVYTRNFKAHTKIEQE